MIFEKQVVKLYKSMMFVRCDDQGDVFYFSPEDFPGLSWEPYPFTSRQGRRLQGYFYYYAGAKPGRVVIFDHGFGGGHRAYMKEIELLCRHGFRVFSYDHTGCMESEGENTNGFLQSLSDLDACLGTLKADPALAGVRFAVMGHSWGGFSALNISALHPDLSHIVVLAGPASLDRILTQSLTGPLKLYRRAVRRCEEEANPALADCDAAESLKKTRARVLILHSEDDPDVSIKVHFDYLQGALGGRENIVFCKVRGKRHNPNYTEDAVRYKDEFFARLSRMRKRGELATAAQKQAFREEMDWERMTAQDMAVWERIFQMLDR